MKPLIDAGSEAPAYAAVSLTGDTAALILNGQPIYERELEPTNQRTFGLFHYADQTNLWVREVVNGGGDALG